MKLPGKVLVTSSERSLAEKIPVTVAGPLGEKVSCYYGFLEETKTAVMEMASAAGITLVTKKDPLRASTYGVGEMIADALKRGCKNFMIGIGGSATNDGGIGMLKALGFEFFEDVLGIGEVTRGAFVGIRKRAFMMCLI